MTGSEAWSLIAPMIYMHSDSEKYPESYNALMEAYVLTHIGLTLYDNWVAHGKPKEWQRQEAGR